MATELSKSKNTFRTEADDALARDLLNSRQKLKTILLVHILHTHLPGGGLELSRMD
jgi:hypothetical protein